MMNDLGNNLKFEYLNRDAGNYKQYGSVILVNPTRIQPEIAKSYIKAYLIDGEFFYPEQVQVPLIETFEFDSEVDHDWYEFEKFSWTDEMPTESITAQNFLDRFA
jgi:hypothetical protein